MIEQKQGWIFAEAEFFTERELIEKMQEKKKETKGDRELKRLLSKDDEEESDQFIFPEDLTPIYRKIRFLKSDVLNYKECISNSKFIDVCLKYEEGFTTLNCSVEEFDKVFFKKKSFKEWFYSFWN